MRFYIRTKKRYDPSNAFTDSLIAVNVDHTQEITKIKEEARKVGKGCKITALYVARQGGSFVDLADDRTINYYNLQDGMILETTSNPFWVTTLYSNMRRREQEAASNPEDARLCFQAQKSYIHRCMAIGLLLNGTGETEKQPATFHALEDLYEYCVNRGKKPAYMSQFTLEELQEMFEMFQEEHQDHRDPIGSFIYSQAIKLSYLEENNTIDANDPFRSHFEQAGEQQRDVPARRNGPQNRNGAGGGGGRRRANRNRTCDDCEIAMAMSYCSECNPPLCLCDGCWRSLHRGAMRKNHQAKDISEAPTPTTYTPQAYRAPFAMLVAFHRALQQRPQKLSLTAEDIKTRAQPFTDTDLEEAKQRGKPFSGFDSLENALMKHDIVLKEAADTPKYSLLESGKELALKCSHFDYAVQALLRQAEVPTVPMPALRPATLNNRQVCLLVDTEEPLKERFLKVASERGLLAKVRKLPSGDFCWILLPQGAEANDAIDVPDQELVLPYLVERKTWDDLWSSVRSPRFENQVQRMKACGIQNLFYLVEGSPKSINGRPGPEVEAFLQGKLDRLLLEDKLFVNRTPSWLKTVEWLCHLTNLAIACQRAGGRKQWMTFAEFSRTAKKLPVAGNVIRNTNPAAGIVWSASDFSTNIRSHHKQEKAISSVLDQVPHTSDSLLVIQGLTAYNTNCNSALKKALADYLKVPGQTAEECVQIHLEDYTDQLISINVFQYYVLYLEVFKQLRIYRTETAEETQEFLSRFRAQETAVKIVQRASYPADNESNGLPGGQADQKTEEVLFANDSQEEEFMLNQALQQSLADENEPHRQDINNQFDHNNLDDVGNGTINDDGCDDDGEDGSGCCGVGGVAHKGNPKESRQFLLNQQEKETNLLETKDCAERNNNRHRRNSYPYKPGKKSHSTSTITRKQEAEEEENYLESILQFRFYDSLKSHTQDDKKDDKKELKREPKDEGLRKIMEESMLQYEKEERERKALLSSVYDEEEELRKAIELSTKEVEQTKMGGSEERNPKEKISKSFPSINIVPSRRNNSDGNDDELKKVIELSKKGMIRNRMNGNGKMGNSIGKFPDSNSRKEDTIPCSSDDDYHDNDDHDDELNKVIQISSIDAERRQMDIRKKNINLGKRKNENSSIRNNYSVPSDSSDSHEQLKKVMELSNKELKQNKDEVDQMESTLVDSQEDEQGDCFFDLEVPDFVNSEACDDGVGPNPKNQSSSDESDSSTSIFSCQNNSRKSRNINVSSSSTPCSILSPEQPSIGAVSTLGNYRDEGFDDVLVERQDIEVDEEDDIVKKFKERFGKDTRNDRVFKKYDSHNSRASPDDDAVIVDSRQDVEEEDDDVVKKFKERFGKDTRNDRVFQKDDSHNSGASPVDDAVTVDSQDIEEEDDTIVEKFKERSSKDTRSDRVFQNNNSHNSGAPPRDDAVTVDSQDDDADEDIARKLQKRFDKKGSSFKVNKDDGHSLSSCFNDAIFVESQDGDADEDLARRLQEKFDNEASNVRVCNNDSHNKPPRSYGGDSILVDSQDDLNVNKTTDREIALKLKKELHRQANDGNVINRPSTSTFTSMSSNFNRVNTSVQITSYREEQQKKFSESKTGKASKNKNPGLAFRQKAEAIARGKESLLAVVRPLGLTENTPRRKPEKRGHDGTTKSWRKDSPTGKKTHSARKSFPSSTIAHTETRNDQNMDSSDTSCLVFPGLSSRPRQNQSSSVSRKPDSSRPSSSSSSLDFPGSFSSPSGYDKQSTSKSSGFFSFPDSSLCPRDSSTSNQNDTSNGFVFPRSAEFSSSPRSKPSTDALTSHCTSQSDYGSATTTTVNGPKCSECGQIGHRKGTKRCPYYYTEEAQRKREEQTRKRKEKHEEEERQLQTSIDAVTAEQLRIAEQAEQLRRQVEEFNQQNHNLPKVVEDAMKYLKKRRRK